MSRPRFFRAAAAAAALAATTAASVARAAPPDLVGTWHVLVHYKDENAQNADAERWEDRVWVFSREGDRLRWVDYPLVVLSDESGRFERLGTNRASRTLRYWTPSAAQAAELQAGPRVNSRGSRSKTLRSTDGGWQSTAAQQRSANYLTYEEHWSISGAELPVFTRTDVLGGGMAEDTEGRTLYETKQVDDGVLRGAYDRDGTKKGSFTLTRVGEAKLPSKDDPTPNEKAAEAREEFWRQLESGAGEEEAP
jgi:hypothetical protein